MAELPFRTERTQGEEVSESRAQSRAILCLAVAAVADDLLGNRARLVPVTKSGLLLGRGEQDAYLTQTSPPELRVKDNRMSGRHAALRLTESGVLVEDLGSTNGTRINGEKVRSGLLLPGGYLEVGHTVLACGLLDEDGLLPLAETAMLGPTRSVVPSVLGIIERARLIAVSTVSVLLLGESGTGKEVLARTIHEQSGRKGRLVPVQCGAIPENLIESELFGYKKGAFTGALSSQDGLVVAADGGTLFLDEIGEMPATAQVRLLRVLQEREVMPVGDTRPRKVDIRVIAATNKDLRSLALGGQFRGDLYARLDGISFRLPRLTERRGDLGTLIAHFLRRAAGDCAPRCAPQLAALRLLFRYSWPFNIRELEKTIEAAVVLSGRTRAIEPRDLPVAIQEATEPCMAPPVPAALGVATVEPLLSLSSEDQALRARLVDALARHTGNVSAVARDWGKARMQIQRWIKRFGLE